VIGRIKSGSGVSKVMTNRLVIGAFLAVIAFAIGIYATTTPGQSGRRIPAQPRQTATQQPAASADETTPSFTSDDVGSSDPAPAPAPVGHVPDASSVARAAGPIAWRTSFAAAKSSAKPGQVIFVDVYTDWCGWCKYMDQRVYTDQGVQRFAANQVFVKLDAEDNAEGTAFARSVGVRGFPTLLASQPGAFRRADDFLSWLQSTSSRR
jgi:thiol-disulfide isomerase/thioredoxin